MKKRFISIIVCLTMILSYAPYVQAFEITQEIVSMDLCVTYASNVVADLEKLPDVNFSDDAVYLSQPIEIVNDNNPFNYAFLFLIKIFALES